MNKKFSLGICISLIAIACAITFVITMTVSLNIYNLKIAGVEEREEIYTKLQEVDSYFRINYISEINKEDLLISILNGYMAGTNDPQAKYLTASEYYELGQLEKGKIITAGMQVSREESGYIKVNAIYENSSAEIHGVQVNDIITGINGINVLEMNAENAIKQLSGDAGTRISITVQRNGEEIRYALIRQEIEVKSVTGTIYNNYGFIKINGFSELSGAQFTSVTEKMFAENVKGLIFDLRGTNGYLVKPINDIMNQIIPSSVLATAEYKGGSVNNIIVTTDVSNINLPVIVLVDSGTSGAGELFTAILKDFKNAQLVGTNTAGNATFSHTQGFRDGSAVRLSNMKVKSAGKTDFAGVGIKPDFVLEMNNPIETDLKNLDNTNDLQIKKAFEILETSTQTTSLITQP